MDTKSCECLRQKQRDGKLRPTLFEVPASNPLQNPTAVSSPGSSHVLPSTPRGPVSLHVAIVSAFSVAICTENDMLVQASLLGPSSVRKNDNYQTLLLKTCTNSPDKGDPASLWERAKEERLVPAVQNRCESFSDVFCSVQRKRKTTTSNRKLNRSSQAESRNSFPQPSSKQVGCTEFHAWTLSVILS